MAGPKLYMLLLGCKPPGRHTEQHDIFFGIGDSIQQLIPEIETFWPEPRRIHVDAWREVNIVDDFRVEIRERGMAGSRGSVMRDGATAAADRMKLFFINLGGYQEGKFEEQHYFLLTVRESREEAIRHAKDTIFFQRNHFAGANSHIDDKYGIDVDDLYEIEEILSPGQKERYQIGFCQETGAKADELHLGYLKLTGSL
jgi:hypothetical protein